MTRFSTLKHETEKPSKYQIPKAPNMMELINGYSHNRTWSDFETTELLRKTSGNGSCIPEKKTNKTCRKRTGKQLAKTKTKAQEPRGVFFWTDTLTRKSWVTRKPGSKNPNENTIWILQKLACCSRVREEMKGKRYFRRKKDKRRSSLKAQREIKETRRKRTVQRELNLCKWCEFRDLKRRLKTNAREMRERRRRPVMQQRVDESKRELKRSPERVVAGAEEVETAWNDMGGRKGMGERRDHR